MKLVKGDKILARSPAIISEEDFKKIGATNNTQSL